ncbi:MAG: hypothetical protein FJ150_02715 [Euryarchaeota archaeon]|nr:hypothetical protein [Euryarchaeota archaeon]
MKKILFVLLLIGIFIFTTGLKPTQEYKTITKRSSITSQVTDNDIWVPEKGKSIVLMGIVISGNSSGQVSFDASKAIVAPFMTASQPAVIGNGTPIYQGTENEVIRFSNVVGERGTGPISNITLWGWEE